MHMHCHTYTHRKVATQGTYVHLPTLSKTCVPGHGGMYLCERDCSPCAKVRATPFATGAHVGPLVLYLGAYLLLVYANVREHMPLIHLL